LHSQIGKRIKKSKIKIVWRFAFEDLVPHVIELKHSLVTGKREIKKDGAQEYQFRNVFSGKFVYPVTIRTGTKAHSLRVMIEEHLDGVCKYDLEIDGCVFHRLRRKSAQELSDLRAEREREAASVTKLEYNSFVKSASSKALDGDLEAERKKEKKEKKKKKKSKEKKQDTTATGASASASASAPASDGWDAFDGSSAAAAPPSAGFDPFAEPAPAPGGAAAVPHDAFNPFGDNLSGPAPPMAAAAQPPAPSAAAAQPLTSSLADLDFTTSFEKPSAEELATAAQDEEDEDNDLLGGAMMMMPATGGGGGGDGQQHLQQQQQQQSQPQQQQHQQPQPSSSNNPFGDGVESLLVNLDNINLAPTSVHSSALPSAQQQQQQQRYGRPTGPAGASGYGGGMYPQQQQQQHAQMGSISQVSRSI
jgi:hypothetical protein